MGFCESARSALLFHPAVHDCVVVERSAGGGVVHVAYVARASRVDADQLRAHLSRTGAPVPDLFAFVARVPCLANGQVDVEGLTAVGIADESLARRVEEQVGQVPGVRAVAAVQRGPSIELLPWHADDLEAPRERTEPPAVMPGPSAPGAATSPAASDALAVADGGPLPEPEPGEPLVLYDALRRAATREDAPGGGLTYVDHDGRDTFESYASLLARSEQAAAAFHGMGLRPGDRVLLLVPGHQEFLTAFWGCLLGGFAPVPLALPVQAQGSLALESVRAAWRVVRPSAVVTSAAAADVTALIPADGVCPVLSPEDLRSAQPAPAHAAAPDDLALLMMTSGSTGEPKAVRLTHRNVLSRTVASRAVNGFSSADVSVNWMPLDHVAGLIYFHIRDVYLGAHQVHVPTTRVVQDPLTWLDALDRYRATVTFAPNFAFGLVLDRAPQSRPGRFDLSCVRFVLNGAEAIVARTARRFLQALAPHGLRPTAMRPAWGMSETSSGVTYDARFSLETTTDEQPFVPVGRPIPSCEMRIVDADDRPVVEGEVGRLQVRGLSVTAGYFNAPELTRQAFTADGWFKTGDLGLLQDGILTVTGREKDVVIVNSVNYHAHAIEAVVESVSGVVPSFAAACAVRRAGADTDSLAVFFASKYDDPMTLAGIVRRVRSEVSQRAGISPATVLPVPPPAIPKTSLGKIQRTELARRFMAGEFDARTRDVDRLIGGERTIPRWFFRRTWIARQMDAPSAAWDGHPVILLGGNTPLGVHVERELRHRGARAVVLDADADAAHLAQLCSDLASQGQGVKHVMDLSDYGPGPADPDGHAVEQVVRRGALTIVGLARALQACGDTFEHVRLTCVASRVNRIEPGDEVVAARSATVALLKSLAQEQPSVRVRHLDLSDHDHAWSARAAVDEHGATGSDREVAYRHGRRLVARVEPVAPGKPGDLLRPHGHYLVTGGAGGVGAELAAFLADRFHATVLLAGRRPAGQGPSALVDRLRRAGGDVSYVVVDVGAADALEAVVAEHERRCGRPLDGAFHLAGEYHEAPVAEESEAGLAAALWPKVAGTVALHRVLQARGGGLLVSWSSVAGAFGGAGIGAYAAANAFQHAHASWAMDHGQVTHKCLDWSTWADTGQSKGYPSHSTRARGYLPMPPAKALASLVAALGAAGPSLIVGLDAANHHVRRVAIDDGPLLDEIAVYVEDDGAAAVAAAAAVADRFGQPVGVKVRRLPVLPRDESGQVDVARLERGGSDESESAAADAPTTETERRLERLWRRALSVASVGARDNFFDCGGDSLSAVRLVGLVRDEFGVALPLRAIFEAGSLAGMALQIDAQPVVPPDGETPHEAPAPDPLSAGQRSLWFMQALAPNSASLNIAFTARVVSAIDATALRLAFQALVDRHPSLRSVFPADGGVPFRRSLTPFALPFDEADTAGWPDTDVLRAIKAEIDRPFDLATGPLLRVRLFRGSGGLAHLAVTVHHIILDGWSLWACLAELPQLYEAALRDVPLSAAAPAADAFSAFVRAQADMVDGPAGRRALDFWRAHLGDTIQPLTWPADRPRPATPTFAGESCRFRIGHDLTRRLRSLARAEQCTLPMVLLAIFQSLLHRYSGQEDVIVGYLASGRSQGRFDALVGYLANPLPLRSVLTRDTSFTALLCGTRDSLLDALEHQDYPFPLVVEHLAPSRDASRTPLFQTLFVFEKPQVLEDQHASAFAVGEPGLRMRLGPLELESLPFAAQREGQFDLTLVLAELDDDLVASIDYRTDLFDRDTIDRCAAHFRRLAECVAGAPAASVSAADILSPDERATLVSADTAPLPFEAAPLHRLVSGHAARQPDATAVVFNGQTLSYAALDARARALARVLRTAGVAKGTRVGLCAERSLDLVVGVLGILQAGGAFVPLDPAYPEDRLAYMFADAQVGVLVTQQPLASRFQWMGRHVYLDAPAGAAGDEGQEDAAALVLPDDLAYVIYTSGSSGRPKGVLVPHRGLANVAAEQQRLFGVGPGWNVLQFASISFDAFVFELTMALASGATLHLAPSEALLPGVPLLDTLERRRIAIATLPPSALQNLPEAPLPHLKVITVAGETCGADLVSRWAPGRRFYNLYGPTEATIWATAAHCQEGTGTPTIGRALANTEAYVLDDRGQLVARGVAGELHLGGVGVALGYHNQPELTAHAFVPNPFGAPGTRMYRTGDRVRRLATGDLEFLGRADAQVKVRGFRVELGEIEALLNQHPDVEQAVAVVLGQESAAHIVAYVVPCADASPSSHALRTFMRARVPEFMVPTVVTCLDALPLNPAGKVDRTRLPAPVPAAGGEIYVAPSSAVEAELAGIWALVLRLDRVGLDDNFFDVGGTSLLVAQLHARLEQRAPGTFSMVDLFSLPTVRAQAARVTGTGPDRDVQLADAAAGGRERLRALAARRASVEAGQ